MPEASFPVEAVSGVPVVTAPGEIDITNAARLRAALLEAAGYGSRTLVVDMTRTRFCDSAGLHVLVSATAGPGQRRRAAAGHLRCCRPPHPCAQRARPSDPQFPEPGPRPRARGSRFHQPARRAGRRARGPGNAGSLMTSSALLVGAADVLLGRGRPRRRATDQEAFEDHHLGLQLHVVGDGETAMRFLRRTDDFAGMARPTLVLLDLNAPPRRPGGPRRAQGRPRPAHHPRGRAHHIAGRDRHPAQLLTARQRLRHQAVRRRPVRRRDQAHRRLLPDLGETPAIGASARPLSPCSQNLFRVSSTVSGLEYLASAVHRDPAKSKLVGARYGCQPAEACATLKRAASVTLITCSRTYQARWNLEAAECEVRER